MPEATIVVYRGDFTFDLEALDAVILAHWPARRDTGRSVPGHGDRRHAPAS